MGTNFPMNYQSNISFPAMQEPQGSYYNGYPNVNNNQEDYIKYIGVQPNLG